MCICEHQVGTICVFFFLLFINYFRCLDPHAIHLNFLYFLDCEFRRLSGKRKTLRKRLGCPLALIRIAEEMSNQSISAFAFDVVVSRGLNITACSTRNPIDYYL